jgi:predicted metal-binding membrane protein
MNKLSSSRPVAIRIQTQHIVFICFGVLFLAAWAYFLLVRIQSVPPQMSHQWTHSSDDVVDLSDDVAPSQMIDITRALVNPAGPLPAVSGARSVSVIIVSHQEELLQPTVKQLLLAASHELIAEVLIIDDFSQPPVC